MRQRLLDIIFSHKNGLAFYLEALGFKNIQGFFMVESHSDLAQNIHGRIVNPGHIGPGQRLDTIICLLCQFFNLFPAPA